MQSSALGLLLLAAALGCLAVGLGGWRDLPPGTASTGWSGGGAVGCSRASERAGGRCRQAPLTCSMSPGWRTVATCRQRGAWLRDWAGPAAEGRSWAADWSAHSMGARFLGTNTCWLPPFAPPPARTLSPYSCCMPLRTPRSPVGRTSGLPDDSQGQARGAGGRGHPGSACCMGAVARLRRQGSVAATLRRPPSPR